MIKEVEKNTYSIGTYTVKLIGDKWHLSGGNLEASALFTTKWDALSTANLRYTCGQLVSEGVKDILLLMEEGEGEE